MIEKLIATGKVNSEYLGYYVDACTMKYTSVDLRNACLMNTDYLVARRGLFFDLTPWGDEVRTTIRPRPSAPT